MVELEELGELARGERLPVAGDGEALDTGEDHGWAGDRVLGDVVGDDEVGARGVVAADPQARARQGR